MTNVYHDTTVDAGPHNTDMGNSLRLAAQHRQNLRYCWAWHKWLAWDGKRWLIDAEQEAIQRARLVVRQMYTTAGTLTNTTQRTMLAEHAKRCESLSRIKAMVDLARSEEGMDVKPEQLDTDIWLLNCQNGTLDLRTGELREHRQADFITKLCPVEYRPQAECPAWVQFLVDIFAGSDALIGFVQRLLGYCLTGSVQEQNLPIFYGVGANGKSTLLGVVLEMLGLDFAIKAAPELVMLKTGAHPTEVADLFGKRVVAVIETGEGRRLAETLVKDMTGGDKLRARRMREDFWQFDPTHKLLLATNHKPEIRGTDHAIWRRVQLVPFAVVIPEDQQDKTLPDTLRAELPGILHWCLQGCLSWQQNGLQPPEQVKIATAEYRQTQDVLGSFIEEKCVVSPNVKVRAGKLYSSYKDWADCNAEHPVSQTRFGETLTERGFARQRSGGWWRLGIGLQLND